MTPAEIRDEIGRLRADLAELKKQRAAHEQELERELGVQEKFFNQPNVDALKWAIACIDHRQAQIADRIGALKRQLPGEATVRAAIAAAAGLRQQCGAASERFDALWPKLVGLLEDVDALAREVAIARSEAAHACARLTDVIAAAGLVDQVIPAAPESPSQEAKLVHLIGLLLAEVPYGDPSDTLLRDLNATRATLERGAERIAS